MRVWRMRAMLQQKMDSLHELIIACNYCGLFWRCILIAGAKNENSTRTLKIPGCTASDTCTIEGNELDMF